MNERYTISIMRVWLTNTWWVVFRIPNLMWTPWVRRLLVQLMRKMPKLSSKEITSSALKQMRNLGSKIRNRLKKDRCRRNCMMSSILVSIFLGSVSCAKRDAAKSILLARAHQRPNWARVCYSKRDNLSIEKILQQMLN